MRMKSGTFNLQIYSVTFLGLYESAINCVAFNLHFLIGNKYETLCIYTSMCTYILFIYLCMHIYFSQEEMH